MKDLENIISKDSIRYNEPMSKHTTMKCGGNVDVMVIPKTVDELISVFKYAKENDINVKVLGCGSNVIVSDYGIEGIIIKITNKLQGVNIEGEYVTVSLGTSMPRLSRILRDNNLSGFEFACGIPGTIGAGVKMNAGAYNGCIADVLVSCKYLNDKFEVCEIENKDMDFGYRHSIFTENSEFIVLEAKFKFNKKDKFEIDEEMKKYINARREKQPINLPSAGSVFRRPTGYYVGKLVQDSDLRGYKIGGAQVSTKHTGFIVNNTGATCEDIKKLIKHIQDTVYEKFNVHLKTEVEIIGRKK